MEIPNRHAKYYPGLAAYRVSVKRKTRPSHSGNIQWLRRYYYISENSAYRSVSKPSISESIAPLDIPQARRYFSFHPQLPGESAPEPRRRHRPKSPSAVPGNKAGHLRNSRARPLPMIRHLRFSYTIYRENFRTKGCCRSSFSSWQPMPGEVSAPGFIAAILFPFTCSAATIRADAEEKITRSLIIVLNVPGRDACSERSADNALALAFSSLDGFSVASICFSINDTGLIIYLLGSAAGIFARRYPSAIHSQSIFTCGQNPNRPVCRDFGLILL